VSKNKYKITVWSSYVFFIVEILRLEVLSGLEDIAEPAEDETALLRKIQRDQILDLRRNCVALLLSRRAAALAVLQIQNAGEVLARNRQELGDDVAGGDVLRGGLERHWWRARQTLHGCREHLRLGLQRVRSASERRRVTLERRPERARAMHSRCELS